MSAGHFLSSLFDETEKKAKEKQDKFDKERQGDIEMYRRVLLDPNASPEQRTKAAQEIEKLRNIKGKDGPFSGLANILNTIKGHHGKMQPPPNQAASQNEQEIPKAGGGGIPSGQPRDSMTPLRPGQTMENLPSPKRNVAERVLSKATHGLGTVTGSLGSHPRQLPGLNPDAFAFPSEKEIAQKNHVNEVKQLRDDLKEAFPNATDESIQKLVEQRFGGHASSTGGAFTKKGSDSGKSIPQGEKDILGNSIDPNKSYDILENGRGEKQYVSSQSKKQIRTLADEHGLPADFVVDLNNPDRLIKVGAKPEQAEYKVFTDPKTQEQYAVPVPRYVGRRGVSGNGGGMAPPPSQRSASGQPSARNGQFNTSSAPGMLTPGNIDIHKRPKVQNADGTISTVRSMSFNENGKEILVPTVSDDGRIMSNQEAIDQYHKTGKHLGIFDTPQHATDYSLKLHDEQDKEYSPSPRKKGMSKPPGSPKLDSGKPKGAISLGKKDTNTARAKAEQATVVISQGRDLIAQIEAAKSALGPWKGRISSLEVGAGSADPKIRALYTSLKSFAALQPALHGSRGIGMQKEFEAASGKLADDPDAAIAAIRSLMNTAKHFAEAGGEGDAVKDEDNVIKWGRDKSGNPVRIQ